MEKQNNNNSIRIQSVSCTKTEDWPEMTASMRR